MYLGLVIHPVIDGDGGGTSGPVFLPRALPLPKTPAPAPVGNPNIIVRGPLPWSPAPAPTLPPAGGSPVPAGFPTSQIFVNSDGSFWEYSPSLYQWVNVGIPYGTGATATPPATPPGSTGGNTIPPSSVAPAPVAASSAPIVTGTSYQEILDWLNEDSLLSTLGFAGIPNWITSSGVALILYKVSNKQGRGR